jgi:hypothetical protein
VAATCAKDRFVWQLATVHTSVVFQCRGCSSSLNMFGWNVFCAISYMVRWGLAVCLQQQVYQQAVFLLQCC